MPTPDTSMGTNVDFRWINAQDLFIDESYQRSLNRRWVLSIAKSFDPEMLDPLHVSERDNGKFAVLDGQHRLLAIREIGWGDQLVPCVVREHLTVEREAEAFASQKNRRNLTRYDLHRAAIVAQDPIALKVEEAVKMHGFHVSTNQSENGVQAVAALYSIATRYGINELKFVLGVARDAWDAAPMLKGLRGIAYLFNKFPQVDRDTLVAALSTTNPGRFEGQTRAITKDYNISSHVVGAYVAYQLYQKKARGKKRLPMWILGSGTDEHEPETYYDKPSGK